MKKVLMVIVCFCIIGVAKAEELEKVGTYEKYIITTTTYDSKGKIILTTNEEVTKEEALNANTHQTKGSYVQCGSDTGFVQCYETNSKLLKLDYYRKSSNPNVYYVDVINTWYTVPSVQDYDVIAIRWTGNATITDVSGVQTANQGTLNQKTNYDSNGTNIKKGTNGVGISMNMYNSSENHQMTLSVVLETSTNPGTVYGTYQHARNTAVTLDISKSYTFSESGLGKVLLYNNSTYSGYYDGMLGVSGTFRTVN